MIGAIVGDIAGSRFEIKNYKAKDFEFLSDKCRYTDDSVMSLAICEALLNSDADYSDLSEQAQNSMKNLVIQFPWKGYGQNFIQWAMNPKPEPYGSYGNGAAMRVSGCGYVGNTIDEVKKLSEAVTCVTHNHPEGIKGAEATAVAVFLARTGESKSAIREYIQNSYYPLDFTLDGIRETYKPNQSCQGTVPQAIVAFLESDSFEDAIRNAISIGGDSDTIAAIAGSIAEPYYGVPREIRERTIEFLDPSLLEILSRFEEVYPPKIIQDKD
ncbi:ADP-ribosylglycohydrolase family protein [Alloscardovia criceti]|uniref:ADP-ribosylglycohydrolase family protein n=1 Tax=Alloscardovia criceti TaxID=356828 RepID=UPI0003633B95|nr:ADP-ribosylglycohydrolase family protein [Alloscardovia criceti]